MKLSEIKSILQTAESVNFELENGTRVPENFHVTEVGVITKNFIDCGGTVRNEKVANFQLWDAQDYDHRLKPQKLLTIIDLSEKTLGMEDLEVEVEYQSDTIGKYGLGHNGENFILEAKTTNCLASDKCGIPQEKTRINLIQISTLSGNSCAPGSGCC